MNVTQVGVVAPIVAVCVGSERAARIHAPVRAAQCTCSRPTTPEFEAFSAHPDVPRGGSKFGAMSHQAFPPADRTSISESFSSVRSMMATSESGRRKSWRCLRIVASTPYHCALPLASSARVSYGSGWTRKRYQLSSCDSIPQP